MIVRSGLEYPPAADASSLPDWPTELSPLRENYNLAPERIPRGVRRGLGKAIWTGAERIWSPSLPDELVVESARAADPA